MEEDELIGSPKLNTAVFINVTTYYPFIIAEEESIHFVEVFPVSCFFKVQVR